MPLDLGGGGRGRVERKSVQSSEGCQRAVTGTQSSLPHTDGETEAHAPNTQSGIFVLYTVWGSYRAVFGSSKDFPEAVTAALGHPHPSGEGRAL